MRFDIYIGHNYDNGTQTWDAETVFGAIHKAAQAQGFSGLTLVDAQGYWRGIPERTTIVTIYETERGVDIVHAFARIIAKELQQEYVLVSRSECTNQLVPQ